MVFGCYFCHMNLFYTYLIEGDYAFFSPDETVHIRHSLRKKRGDALHFTDGKGYIYTSVLEGNDRDLIARITTKEWVAPPNAWADLCVSPLKQPERNEWLLEKAVEFGVRRVYWLACTRTEKHHLKMDRLQRIAISALKQSKSAYLPEIHDLIDFAQVVQTPFEGTQVIPWCGHSGLPYISDCFSPGVSVRFFVGPEGDFTDKEIEVAASNGLKACSLGKRILRAESAGIFTLATFNAINRI
jgi:16S rRNA (uracil1498-N3)-methyltransferase